MSSYRDTLFLPRTDFAIRAAAAQNEPQRLARWQKAKLDEKLFQSTAADRFVLHDGPPYANGNIHMGHAFNKLLKDIINRIQRAVGKEVEYIPGWDCHGLPIEWEVEKKWLKQGRDKSAVKDFRADCRATAAEWVAKQSAQFRRLGVGGNWEKPYTTMSHRAEAIIAESIIAFMKRGLLYHQTRPVLWSVVERTALAEAEVEYKDKRSWSIFAAFPIIGVNDDGSDGNDGLIGAKAVIWTTTPWTIPANRAVCVGNDIDYILVTTEDDQRLMLAAERLAALTERLGLKVAATAKLGKGKELAGKLRLAHPLYGRETPLLGGDFVDAAEGSGLVHIAPDHGADDYRLIRDHGLDNLKVIGDDGVYLSGVELFAGKHIFKADEAVVDALKQGGNLHHAEQITHAYPHSWRSGKPLIYLATPQWFIDLKKSGILAVALKEVDKVNWHPPAAKRRMLSMLGDRPDWCLSRQRSWGVPLPFFLGKADGEPLVDEKVNEKILTLFNQEGSDAWFNRPPQDFLGGDHKAEDYTRVKDVADVWFDSGLSHRFALNSQPPADLYLEGSDQHRGWFQSSLLTSCAFLRRAPYKAVLTHGFVLDENGYKMSKSRGNTISPQQIIDEYGADPLRLWVALADYRGDLRLGKGTLSEVSELYRRIRNTWRFLLGALAHFPSKRGSGNRLPSALPPTERWLLHRLAELEKQFAAAADELLFHNFYRNLHDFCNGGLSAFYFETIKDPLYCDAPNSKRRLGIGAVLERVFLQLCRWFAPVLCFTADEAWQAYNGGGESSVHSATIEPPNGEWLNPKLGEEIAALRRLRSLVFAEIEKHKEQYPSTLGVKATITAAKPLRESAERLDMAAFSQVAQVEFKDGKQSAVTVAAADGKKCPRCWQYRLEVKDENSLCNRCEKAVEAKK